MLQYVILTLIIKGTVQMEGLYENWSTFDAACMQAATKMKECFSRIPKSNPGFECCFYAEEKENYKTCVCIKNALGREQYVKMMESNGAINGKVYCINDPDLPEEEEKKDDDPDDEPDEEPDDGPINEIENDTTSINENEMFIKFQIKLLLILLIQYNF